MDVRKIIAELQQERACLDQALVCLERLSLKRVPRRGRPPLWAKAPRDTAPKKKVAQAGV
jgi:hypothetical protein